MIATHKMSGFRILSLVALVLTLLPVFSIRRKLVDMRYVSVDFSRDVLALCLLLVSAVGLFLHRRWGALLFSLMLAGVGGELIVGSLLKVPWPWELLNILFGVALFCPLLFTFRNWRMLVWKGRWWL